MLLSSSKAKTGSGHLDTGNFLYLIHVSYAPMTTC